jgi:hypothetical protein
MKGSVQFVCPWVAYAMLFGSTHLIYYLFKASPALGLAADSCLIHLGNPISASKIGLRLLCAWAMMICKIPLRQPYSSDRNVFHLLTPTLQTSTLYA